MGRLGRSKQIEAALAYLVSPLADYVSGAVFRVDGRQYRVPGRSVVGSPRGITPPRLPRIRTCRFPASGSSVHGFAT